MPREQQICEQLASPLLYLFPLLSTMYVIRILSPFSNLYPTDSHWKWSTLPFIPSLQLTTFQYFMSLSYEPRANSGKSTPTLFSLEQSIQPFNVLKVRWNTTLKQSSFSHSHPLLSKTTKWIDKTVIQHIEIASALSYSTQSEMGEWAYHCSLNACLQCFRSIYHFKWRLNGLEDGNRVLWDRSSFKLQVYTFRVMRMSTTAKGDNCQTIACRVISCYFKCYLPICTTCIPENRVSSETVNSQIDLLPFIIEFTYNRIPIQIQTIDDIPNPTPIVMSIPTP